MLSLKFKQPVSVEVVGATEIREYVLARMKKFDQEQHLVTVQRAYALLGLLPEGTDLLALFDRHPCVKAYINGHNHAGNYAERNGVHYLTLKGMVDTDKAAFAKVRVFAKRVVVKGYVRE